MLSAVIASRQRGVLFDRAPSSCRRHRRHRRPKAETFIARMESTWRHLLTHRGVTARSGAAKLRPAAGFPAHRIAEEVSANQA